MGDDPKRGGRKVRGRRCHDGSRGQRGRKWYPVALKTKGEASSQGMRAPPEPGRGRTWLPSPSLQRSPWGLTVNSRLPESWVRKSCCCKPLNRGDFFQPLQEENAQTIIKMSIKNAGAAREREHLYNKVTRKSRRKTRTNYHLSRVPFIFANGVASI